MSLATTRGVGTVFEVTNSIGVKSFLIGTMHTVDKESVEDKRFRKILDKCSTLYTEMGNNFLITSSHGSIPEGDHPYRHIPLRYAYDEAIGIYAWCKKIPNISLDEKIPDQALALSSLIQRMRTKGPDFCEKVVMDNLANTTNETLLKKWKDGSVFKVVPRPRDSAEAEEMHFAEELHRENVWCETLIPTLLTTQKPICIAVGAIHVAGAGSLSERFKKAGLKVELLPNNRPRSFIEILSRL